MSVSYFYLALVVGLCLGLLMEEFFGITAGGMVVPGYMAMVCDNVKLMLMIFAISFVIYGIVNYILPRFVILFGKRKFVATLIIGIILKLVVELLFPTVFPFSAIEFRGIGVITPSLLASNYARQGIRYTVPSALLVTYLTFAIVSLFFWIF